MTYGIVIRTSTGQLTSLESVFGALLHTVVQANSVTGSVTIPTWNSPNGDFFVHNETTKVILPAIAWNNSTKVLNWWNYYGNNAGYSNTFKIYCLDI